jgi:putative ABC transport system permease protein
MTALDLKLLRDIRRLWPQALAIALVIAGAVATLVLAAGSYRSLEETRIAYYERHRFADVFASVRRAPKTLVGHISEIPGVAAVDVRIASLALLDIPAFREPATAQLISLPEMGEPLLNVPYLRLGRLPDPDDLQEAVINERFAEAHGFAPGSRFSVMLNGRKRELEVVGIALSPEFVYTIGPGDVTPDNRRFGIIWMSEKALASAYDLAGAFSSVSVKLLRGASQREVIQRLDAVLERYGGRAAYGRKDQNSHAFLDHMLDMLKNMSRTLPPIFLGIAAFLVNVTLTRLVTLEREQIGLMKAVGYGDLAVAGHYVKFVIAIAVIGVALGGAAGTLLGSYVTGLYGTYFAFPFLVFTRSPDLYVLAAVLSLAAAVFGAVRALREVVRLPPAVAMQPPAPPRFRHLLPAVLSSRGLLRQPAVMMLRNATSHPLRAAFTMLGMAMSTGILIVSLYIGGAMEQLIDVTYFQAERQDATVSFVEKRPANVVTQLARLPGVLATEPVREVPARIRNGHIERRVAIRGSPGDADLSRIIDTDLQPVVLPSAGLALSEWLADILRVDVGDLVEVDLLEGERRTVVLPVTARIEDYLGIKAIMDAEALARLMREAPTVTSVHLSLDENRLDPLYDAIKSMPIVAGMALQRVSLTNFRKTLAVIVNTMGGIYTGLAGIIAFGVVYNSARIALSERARELASLRVLGFTRGEVLQILLLELAILTLIAQPPGWAIGYGLAWTLKVSMDAEVMRSPLVIERLTYLMASAVVLVAALASALVVRRRVNRLDLVGVLKTRD